MYSYIVRRGARYLSVAEVCFLQHSWLRRFADESATAFFFFQAEDGIRDVAVTGVQTCALPISASSWSRRSRPPPGRLDREPVSPQWPPRGGAPGASVRCRILAPGVDRDAGRREIGRASCRERV